MAPFQLTSVDLDLLQGATICGAEAAPAVLCRAAWKKDDQNLGKPQRGIGRRHHERNHNKYICCLIHSAAEHAIGLALGFTTASSLQNQPAMTSSAGGAAAAAASLKVYNDTTAPIVCGNRVYEATTSIGRSSSRVTRTMVQMNSQKARGRSMRCQQLCCFFSREDSAGCIARHRSCFPPCRRLKPGACVAQMFAPTFGQFSQKPRDRQETIVGEIANELFLAFSVPPIHLLFLISP